MDPPTDMVEQVIDTRTRPDPFGRLKRGHPTLVWKRSLKTLGVRTERNNPKKGSRNPMEEKSRNNNKRIVSN